MTVIRIMIVIMKTLLILILMMSIIITIFIIAYFNFCLLCTQLIRILLE